MKIKILTMRPFLQTHVRQSSKENDSDDVPAIRRDHEEGKWEN